MTCDGKSQICFSHFLPNHYQLEAKGKDNNGRKAAY